MSFNYIYLLLCISFIVACYIAYKLYKTTKLETENIQILNDEIKKHFIERMKANHEVAQFLIGAYYLEKFAKLNNNIVYKYIYKNNRLYKFVDFIPKYKKLNSINDHELFFESKQYSLLDLSSVEAQEILKKYEKKLSQSNDPKKYDAILPVNLNK